MNFYDHTVKRKFNGKNPLIWKIIYVLLLIPAYPLYRLFLLLKVSPSTITWIAIITRVPTITLAINGYYLHAMGLLILGHVLDCVDGAVAYATNNINKSIYAYVDHMFHVISLITMFIIMGYWSGLNELGLYTSIIYLLGQLSFRYKEIVINKEIKKGGKID